MSVAVFKQTLWSKKIQNALNTLTGFIFAIVYLGALQRIKKSFVDIFCCKICKKKRIPTLNSFFILEDMNEDKSIDEIEDE